MSEMKARSTLLRSLVPVVVVASACSANVSGTPGGSSVARSEPGPPGEVSLSLAVEPAAWRSDRRIDVSLSLELHNQSSSVRTLYAKVARWHVVGGWGSPTWTLEARTPSKERHPLITELRTYYGPPSSPPAASYFEDMSASIQPSGSVQHRVEACWIPHSTLERESLSVAVLDPEGYDGIKSSRLEQASALALDRSCRDIKAAERRGPGFLRPGVDVFVPPGERLEVRIAYRQSPWVGFQPAEELSAASGWVSISLGDP